MQSYSLVIQTITLLNGELDERVFYFLDKSQEHPFCKDKRGNYFAIQDDLSLSTAIRKCLERFTQADWYWFFLITQIQVYAPDEYFRTYSEYYANGRNQTNTWKNLVKSTAYLFSRRKYLVMIWQDFTPNGISILSTNGEVNLYNTEAEAKRAALTTPGSFIVEYSSRFIRNELSTLLLESQKRTAMLAQHGIQK